jgi:hypothetical protein
MFLESERETREFIVRNSISELRHYIGYILNSMTQINISSACAAHNNRNIEATG